MTDPWAGIIPLPENRSAVRACKRVAAAAAKTGRVPVSPLVLHGPPGTGKTLLAAAAVAAVTQAPAGRTARVVAANDLDRDDADPDPTADLIDCDFLVLEDLQHLPPPAADAVCKVLDARGSRRAGTIITAGAGPGRLLKLPRRLTSRLAAGLVLAVEPLAPYSRKKAITRLAAARGLRLTPAAIEWLAARPTGGGLRPVLGALDSLRARAGTGGFPLEPGELESLLSTPTGDNTQTPEVRILTRVAAAFGVRPAELKGASRLPRVVLPRQVGMYLAREAAKLPLTRIGAAFGGRDHSTVLYAVRKVTAAVAADPVLAGRVQQLWAELT